jgi:hypothetical protein
MLGDIYVDGKVRPEDLVLVDLDLNTDIGWGIYHQLSPAAATRDSRARAKGHVFVAAKFDGWRSWVVTNHSDELATFLDQSRRPGCTITFGVLEDAPKTPGGFGEVFFRVGLAQPDAVKGAEWVADFRIAEIRHTASA